MTSFGKALAVTAAVGAMVLAAGEAQALPMYTSGSLQIATIVNGPYGNVQDPNLMTPLGLYVLAGGTGDLTGVNTLLPNTTLNFSQPSSPASAASFDWTVAGVGTFNATSVILVGTTIHGVDVTVSYDIFGTFLIGADFSNAGQTVSADETWSLTQTGGPGNSISASGTFAAPSRVTIPEPGTLALLGAGLAGLGALRRRRKAVKTQ